MSDPVGALQPGTHAGFAEIQVLPPQGMIALRGDLSDAGFKAAVTAAVPLDVPGPNAASFDGTRGIFWMSPDELLLLCPYAEVAGHVDSIGAALAGTHHLVADISDARAVFAVDGVDAREVLGKLTPADLAPSVFGPGSFRRTRLVQVAAAVLCETDNRFVLVCFRSVAGYVHELLKTAAIPGSEVGYWRD